MKSSLTQYRKRHLFNEDDVAVFVDSAKTLARGELRQSARLLIWWLHNEGWRFAPNQIVERYQSRGFDRKNGTDTTTRVDIQDMQLVSENGPHGVYYQATPVTSFRKLLRSLDLDFQSTSFIDFGSGKGRTLLLASELPFLDVIGVEFCVGLHAITEENIRLYKNKQALRTRSVCMDATQFQFPDTNLVIYFFNPFDTEILSRVLKNLTEAFEHTNRRVVVIYRYLPDRTIFTNYQRFKVLRDWRRYTILEWTASVKS